MPCQTTKVLRIDNLMNLKRAPSEQTLVVLLAIAGIVLTVRSWRANTRAAAERALYVPVIVSSSVQAASGQALLFKATNLSDGPRDLRLTLFKDSDGLPLAIKSRTTVTYIDNPRPAPSCRTTGRSGFRRRYARSSDRSRPAMRTP